MAFDLLTWAIGFSLSTAGKYIFDKIFSCDLPSKLNKAVEEWSKNLPPEIQFHHEALFDKIISDSELDKFPNLAILRQKLKEKNVPNCQIWFDALYERWKYIRSNPKIEELHPFFAQDIDKVKPHLHVLAKNLETTSKEDRELFQITAIDDIKEIKEDIHTLKTLLNMGTGSNVLTQPGVVPDTDKILIQTLSSALSKEKAARLEEYRELYREGYVKQAYAKIYELTQEDNWELLDKSLRARILRVLSSYALNIEHDIERAKKFAKEASLIDPDADYTVINTFIKYHANGAESALKLIDNIHDIDTFNLKLSLLLEVGKLDQFFVALANKPEHISENAETKRLHALALLLNGKISEALSEIERALYEKPKWESVRIAAAIIDFYSALSPSLLPDRLVPWPEPVSLSFLKHDSESIKRLRRAENHFNELAEQAEQDKQKSNQFRIWQLACLANDPERQDKARSFCSELLIEDPGNPIALVWAIARNYNFDIRTSQNVLENVSPDANDYNLRILALLDLYLLEGKSKEALAVLEKVKSRFMEAGAENTWLIWHSKTLIEAGRPEEALGNAYLAKNTEVQIYIHTIALKEISGNSNDWAPFIEHLENVYKKTGDGQLLYECCRLKAFIGEWSYISERVYELINTVRTHAAVELAAKAAWQSNKPELCLKILNDNAYMFLHGTLPIELHRLKIYCQSRLGLLPQALAEAEELFNRDSSTENLLALMEMQFRKGDLKGLTNSANELCNRSDAKCVDLLRVARLVIFEDMELAIKLWQQAARDALNDPFCVNQAIEIGYRLGLDKELTPFLKQMHVFSSQGEGTVKIVDLQSLLSMIQENKKRRDFIIGKYENAEIPVHSVIESLNFPLVSIYHDIPEQNVQLRSPNKQPPIFIRHGGRPLQKLSKANLGMRLHLDISALLLSSHLGLLEKIEQFFKPLRISPSLPIALIYERDKIAPHQPARINGYKEILRLLGVGKLTETPKYTTEEIEQDLKYLVRDMGKGWVLLLRKATEEKGYIVELFPLTSKNIADRHSVKLNKPYRYHVINCRSLVKSLFKKGKITQEKYLHILKELGTLGRENPEGSLPLIGSKIYLSSGIASELAIADALSIICQHFQVFIDKLCIEEAQQSIKDFERKQELGLWIERLISHVEKGFDAGIYEMISLSQDSDTNEKKDGLNPALVTLTDLFKYTPEQNDVIWIDDRFCNSYVHRDGTPIVGILEILEALKINNIITKNEYYEKILELRASNFRYIPVDRQELLYHLKQAQVIDSHVVETEGLSIIRRYLASCLLDSKRLQMPPVIPTAANPNGEIAFVLSTMRAVADTLIHIWKDEHVTENTVEAYSNWIFINLYVGTFGVRHLRRQDDPNNDGIDLIGLDIGSLFTQGIHFTRSNTFNRRKKYFDWLENRLVRNRFRADPGAVVSTTRALRYLILDMINMPHKNKLLESAAKKILQEFYLDLPESIRWEMPLDSKTMEWLGVKTIDSLKIGDSWFPAHDFWTAVKDALHGKQASVRALQSETEFVIEGHGEDSSERNFIKVKDQNKSTVYTLDDPVLYLLSDNPDERRTILQSNRIWFDCDNYTLEKIITDIITTEDFVRRMRQVDDWRKKSVALFYEHLEHKLITLSQFKFEELIPPSLEGLLRYFRMDLSVLPDSDFPTAIRKSAEILMAEEGLETAINRLSCLPIQLPVFIKDELAKLPINEKKTLLTKFDNQWASPVSKLHLIDLVFSCSEEKTFLIDFISKVVDELYSDSDGANSFRLFKAILLWLSNEFSYSSEAREWPSSVKLAILWAHANMLQNLFKVCGASPAELARIFDSRDYLLRAEILDRDLSFWNDILHPLRLKRTELIVHGLVRVLHNNVTNMLGELNIADKVRNYIVKPGDEGPLSEFFIFTDPELLQNSTDSFLGGDRGKYLTFLEPEISQQLTTENLKNILQSAIEALKSDPHQLSEWSKIYTIVGDLPINDRLSSEFKSLVEKLDIFSLLNKSPLSALMAMHVITKQIMYIGGNQLRASSEDLLIKLATFFASTMNDKNLLKDAAILNEETIAAVLMEDALSIALKPNSPRGTSKEFTRIIGRLFEVWPLTLQKLGNGIFRLAHELPAIQLHGFWPLILVYRATREVD